ncbi:hypothetical protein DERF_002841 [Dermatophagoides farinae]|uniref:Uncharacterized protein n=1 Tax=Dermatophagoides farinae TaxID=6954 RepID=A0A922IGS2_DERFA|nr:hypothetical protein DERF_002841 [Dermatophagoides farinae]
MKHQKKVIVLRMRQMLEQTECSEYCFQNQPILVKKIDGCLLATLGLCAQFSIFSDSCVCKC